MSREHLLNVPYDQRIDALGKANRIRLYRTDIKRCLRNERCKITVEMLDNPDLQGMKIWDLVNSQHRWGASRTGRLLGRLMISGTRKIRELTPRQKEILAGEIRRVNSKVRT
jgi:hypothetical protein